MKREEMRHIPRSLVMTSREVSAQVHNAGVRTAVFDQTSTKFSRELSDVSEFRPLSPDSSLISATFRGSGPLPPTPQTTSISSRESRVYRDG